MLVLLLFILCHVYEVAVSQSSLGPACVAGQRNRGSSCYEFVGHEKTWVDARAYCKRNGGRLANVDSGDLQAWLSTTAANLWQVNGVWHGLHDRAAEGRFTWDAFSGENERQAVYQNWMTGEPNNIGNQDCVYMRRSYDWRWVDVECISSLRMYNFICEYRAILSSLTISATTNSATTMQQPPLMVATTSSPHPMAPAISVPQYSVTLFHSFTTVLPATISAYVVMADMKPLPVEQSVEWPSNSSDAKPSVQMQSDPLLMAVVAENDGKDEFQLHIPIAISVIAVIIGIVSLLFFVHRRRRLIMMKADCPDVVYSTSAVRGMENPLYTSALLPAEQSVHCRLFEGGAAAGTSGIAAAGTSGIAAAGASYYCRPQSNVYVDIDQAKDEGRRRLANVGNDAGYIEPLLKTVEPPPEYAECGDALVAVVAELNNLSKDVEADGFAARDDTMVPNLYGGENGMDNEKDGCLGYMPFTSNWSTYENAAKPGAKK